MPAPVKPSTLKPYWSTTDAETVKLYCGNALAVLKALPPKSVHCVVTSPPYWGLRDYGVDDQLGAEKTPQEFVTNLVAICEEVKRVLRDDGTFWLNLGDTYSSSSVSTGRGDAGTELRPNRTPAGPRKSKPVRTGLPAGNLIGIPWRVAFALQDAGWVLRQDNIWNKPSPMPESVTNRCTKAHEYLFLLTKIGIGYYYDADAIKERGVGGESAKASAKFQTETITNVFGASGNQGKGKPIDRPTTSNKRSVWTVASESFEGAHFAAFPTKLITPCVLAGTSQYGCCAECGAPWERMTEKVKLKRQRPNKFTKRAPVVRKDAAEDVPGNPMYRGGSHNSGLAAIATCANDVAGVETVTTGWKPTCECGIEDVVPATVLDPFMGSGTTAVVCVRTGRRAVGIDLSAKYIDDCQLARIRGAIMEIPALSGLLPEAPRKPMSGGDDVS